jgi:hypothetical protein
MLTMPGAVQVKTGLGRLVPARLPLLADQA